MISINTLRILNSSVALLNNLIQLMVPLLNLDSMMGRSLIWKLKKGTKDTSQ
jgi:uncharacterized Tic20 family protein